MTGFRVRILEPVFCCPFYWSAVLLHFNHRIKIIKTNIFSEQTFENVLTNKCSDYIINLQNRCLEYVFGEVLHMRSERAQQRKYKRDRIRRTKQIIERVLLTICLIALLAIGGSVILTKATTTEEAKNVYYKYYTQIEIEEGDSLWGIAGEYMEHGPYESRKEYMNEVVELNQLSSTTIIKGQHLVVPYFEAAYK